LIIEYGYLRDIRYRITGQIAPIGRKNSNAAGHSHQSNTMTSRYENVQLGEDNQKITISELKGNALVDLAFRKL
jgi:hypothetical protein